MVQEFLRQADANPLPPTRANTGHANVVHANTVRANTTCVMRNLNDRLKRALVLNACLNRMLACRLFHVEHYRVNP